MNYFFVGSAFLVTAFATLIASAKFGLPPAKFILAYVINLVGFFLSFFFAYINFINTKMIWYKDEIIRNYEKKSNELKDKFPAFTVNRKLVIATYKKHRLGDNHLLIFGKMLVESFGFFWNTGKTSKKGLAPHVYIIPLGFCGLWIALYFSILFPFFREHTRTACINTAIFFLPLLVLILFECCLKPLHRILYKKNTKSQD